jgi:WD40 repeat protein
MNNLTPRARERALFLYRNALERGDFDTVARVLRLAEGDSILERMILETSEIDESDSSAPQSKLDSRGIKMIVTIRRRLSPNGWPPKPNSDEENDSMNIVLEPQKMMNRQARYYLTLAAAIAVFILLGGIVFNMIPRLPFRTLNPPQTPSLAVITPENADQIQQIGFLGRGTITDMAWSPDGSVLALGSLPSGIIWLYNPGDLNVEPRWLTGNPGGVTQLAFSADGKTLASVGLDSIIRLWDMATGTERAQFRKSGANNFALSSDGKLVAVGTGRNISVMDTATGEEIVLLEGHEKKVNALVFSPNAKLIVSASEDGTVRVWDVVSAAQLAKLEGHDDAVMSIAFNPDGGMFASGGRDGTVRLWDWNGVAGTVGLVRRGHENTVDKLTFSPDGRILVSAGQDHTIRLWNMDTSVQQAVLVGHTARVRSITFSPDGKTLASVSQDETLRVWDVASGAQINSVEIVRGHLFGGGAAFSPDGNTVATVGDNTIQLWDAARGERRQLIESNLAGGCPAYDPDGKQLVVGTNDKVVIWDLAAGTNRVMGEGILGGICVAYSPDGKTVAASSADFTARLWDIVTGEERILRHKGNVAGVAYSPDGKILASGGTGDGVRLWDVATGEELAFLEGDNVYGMSFPIFSADGRLLAAGGTSGDYDVYVWDVATLSVQAVLPSHQQWPFVSFSPDSKLLVSSDGPDTELNVEGSVRLWDVEKGIQLRILSTYTAWGSAWFNPQGTMIVVSVTNGVNELWGVPNGE